MTCLGTTSRTAAVPADHRFLTPVAIAFDLAFNISRGRADPAT